MPIVLRKKYLSIFWKMAKSLWEDQEINFYWEIIGSATEGSPIKQETISVGKCFEIQEWCILTSSTVDSTVLQLTNSTLPHQNL